MLLRSISKHVKDQNWFAVALDFFIVVLGILIAFRITSWSESRSNSADTHEYLERLLVDMETSSSRNANQFSMEKRHVSDLDTVLSSLESCELKTEDAPVFAAGIYNLGKYNLPTLLKSTIDELNATGKLLLLDDTEIRRLISEVLRFHETTRTIDSQISGRVIPSVNYTRTLVRFNLNEILHNPKTIGPEKVFYNFDDLCTDPTFINAVANVREMTLANIGFNEYAHHLQMELLRALQTNLGIEDQSDGLK